MRQLQDRAVDLPGVAVPTQAEPPVDLKALPEKIDQTDSDTDFSDCLFLVSRTSAALAVTISKHRHIRPDGVTRYAVCLSKMDQAHICEPLTTFHLSFAGAALLLTAEVT
jgi:hypothetical protein